MYLKHQESGDLVEVVNITALLDPSQSGVSGRFHSGEEMQDAEDFAKDSLVFPSGEALPQCWLDPGYRS